MVEHLAKINTQELVENKNSTKVRLRRVRLQVDTSDGKVKLHEALVVSVEPSRWSSLFNKGLKAH